MHSAFSAVEELLESYVVVGVSWRWLWRKRLRLTVTGLTGYDVPVNLHNQQMLFAEHQFWERLMHDNDSALGQSPQPSSDDTRPHVLPVLALNEVYIGETLSPR